jgi:FAD-dependent urate hydroxylase
MKVLVSGAGIGGLAAARGLIDGGHEVTVFEQATELRHGGAAVTLWSNGTGVLSELGISLDGVGAPIDVLETRDHRGKPLVSVDVARSAEHFGHPHVCLPRTRLLGLLGDGLPAGAIRFGCAAARAEEDHGEVSLTFTTGGTPGSDMAGSGMAGSGMADSDTAGSGTGGSATAVGDLLVAADGRGSVLRDQFWGGDPGELTGWATWQGLSKVPNEIAAGRSSVLFVGKPGTCGLMPAGDGLLQWWFDLPWTPATPRPQSPVEMLRERFAHWAPAVREVLSAVTDAETGFFPHYRHRVPKTWGKGRVTVIGDAAHSMPPTRAQGANQALEDAWLLASVLRDPTRVGEADDTAQRLRAFERARAAKVSVVSRQAGSEDYNRYGALVSRLAPSPLVTRYYTRWLRQISNYLDADPAGGQKVGEAR